jgi:uncharacterized protein (TIGR03437 family)
LVYSTYLGGSNNDLANGITVDATGSAYVVGVTDSTDFPAQSAYQDTLRGSQNAFVTKLAPAGNALLYSTFLGGTYGDAALAVAVDGAGAAYVAGQTSSGDFPTQSPFQANFAGGLTDAFVAKLALEQLTPIVVDTIPTGLAIYVDGAPLTAPQAFNWVPGSVHTIGTSSPQQSGGTQYGFTSWSDDGAQTHTITTPSSATEYVAVFIGEYPLILNASPPQGGRVTVTGDSLDGYWIGILTVLATPNSGYQFDGWSGDLTGSLNPAPLAMSAPRNVTANFSVQYTSITVATNPPGLAIYVDGASMTAPQTFSWVSGTGHTIGVYSPQQGAGASYTFVNWSDGGGQTHNITVGSVAATYTATFKAAYQLTTSASPPVGGTVTASPASADGYYNGGSSVQLTATANPGYLFSGWSGGLTGSANPQSLVMSAPRSVTATFTAVGPLISGVVDSAGYRPTIAPNSFVSIFGSNFTSWTGDWSDYATNGNLPTTLGGVQVLIDGKNCFVSYASPTQVNVLTPLDTATGSVSVEVITAQGTATSTATMAQVAPALFGYTLSSGTFYAVAQIANTATIVAPAGTFGSATPSRPAQAGDYLVLYAIGMGSTNPAAPSGVVLPTYYPVSDLSSVKVTFGSANATVLWAGMVYAGEFQVNVQVPSGLSGDEPVVMTVGGQSTQPNAYLTFQ